MSELTEFMKGLMNKNKQTTAHACKRLYVFFNSTECKYHTKEHIFMCEKKPIRDHYFSQFLTFSSLQMCPIGL